MYRDDFKTVKDTGTFRITMNNFVKAMLWAFGFTIAVFIIASMLLAYTPLSENTMPFVVITTAVISIVIAGMMSSKSVKSRGYLNGAMTGVFYIIVLYLLSALMGEGFYFNSYILVMLVVGLFAGAFGGILGINLGDKRKK